VSGWSRRRELVALVVLGLSVATVDAQAPSPDASNVAAFMGTWPLTMTNPAGARETVRIWNENGVVKASVQAGRFPAIAATGILKDADVLVLTLTRFENGQPIRAVVALMLDGGTMKMSQMLERSETIKRGSGTKTDQP
jgi:hypothetical protein